MKGDRPAVDVGVVTWNTREVTVSSLRRLLDSDQGCDIRLLVRDNASDDGTADALARHVPEADLDRGEDNLGFAAGMNTLIRRCDAPWFFALNSDAWPEPGTIGRLVAAAEARSRAAAVAPRLERPDGGLEHSTHRFPSVTLAAVTAVGTRRLRGLGHRLLLEGAWQHDEARTVDWAIGAALLMRRRAIDSVGGFDERFFMYVEDLDWCWRAARRGWEIWFEPSGVVRHIGNASGQRRYGDARTAAYLRNTYRWYRGARGPLSTIAFRGLNLAGAARLEMAARRRGEADRAWYWRQVARAHLAGGRDGEP